jgi:hypothetical protein
VGRRGPGRRAAACVAGPRGRVARCCLRGVAVSHLLPAGLARCITGSGLQDACGGGCVTVGLGWACRLAWPAHSILTSPGPLKLLDLVFLGLPSLWTCGRGATACGARRPRYPGSPRVAWHRGRIWPRCSRAATMSSENSRLPCNAGGRAPRRRVSTSRRQALPTSHLLEVPQAGRAGGVLVDAGVPLPRRQALELLERHGCCAELSLVRMLELAQATQGIRGRAGAGALGAREVEDDALVLAGRVLAELRRGPGRGSQAGMPVRDGGALAAARSAASTRRI